MTRNFKYIFTLFVIFALTVLLVNVVNAQKIQENTTETTLTSKIENDTDFLYRISDFRGKLAVYEGKSKIPYKVYNTYVDSLPHSDQKLLRKGIYLNSFAEVKKIIEEYTS